VLVDTGAIFGLYRAGDAWHDRLRRWIAANRADLVVPVTVLQETAYLMGTVLGPAAEATLLRTAAGGDLVVEQLEMPDVARSADLIEAYRDFPIGFVDASIVAVAERLEVTELLTTDRRHFGVIRPAHCRKLRLLP